MVSGLLTGKMTAERVAALPQTTGAARAIEFNEPRLSRNLRLVELLREIGSGHGVEPGVVAVAWTLHILPLPRPSWAAAAQSRSKRLRRRSHFRLSEEEYERINDLPRPQNAA